MTVTRGTPGLRSLAALLLAYPLAWSALEALSTALAFWPVALRFLLLWWLPTRHWPALVAVDAASTVLARHWLWDEPLLDAGRWAMALMPAVAYATFVGLARRRDTEPEPDTPARMALWLLAGAAGALVVAPGLAFYLAHFRDLPTDRLDRVLGLGFGDAYGLVVLVPMAMALRGDALALWRSRRWGFEAALAAAVTLGLLSVARHRPGLDEHFLLLVFLPGVVLAFRHGWRGAAWAVGVLGLLLAVGFSDHPDPLRLQVMMAVIGSATLLLGAASSQLRAQRDALEAQHASLRLAMLEQRELAGRIVALEDEGQRQVAESLHEQVAPPLQELRTLLAMAWRSSPDERDGRLLESLRGHSWQVQDGLERALRRPQPPTLAHADLAALLGHGPLWEWAEDQGAQWSVAVDGPLQDLPERWKTVVYRIAQAGLDQGLAAGARRVALRIEARRGTDGLALDLTLAVEQAARCVDDGRVLDAVRDRALAAGGTCRREARGDGWRSRVRFAGISTALD